MTNSTTSLRFNNCEHCGGTAHEIVQKGIRSGWQCVACFRITPAIGRERRLGSAGELHGGDAVRVDSGDDNTNPHLVIFKGHHVLAQKSAQQWPELIVCNNGYMIFVQGNNSVMVWEPDESVWRLREYGAYSDLAALLHSEGSNTYVGAEAWGFLSKKWQS